MNENGILFPVGYKFIPLTIRQKQKNAPDRVVKTNAGIIGWQESSPVHLNVCHECEFHQLSSEAAKGECEACGASAYDYLNGIMEP